MGLLWFVLFLGVLTVGVPSLVQWIVGDAEKAVGGE
jgi:hypothetical protein